jgi:hypothetical protein
MDKIRMVVYDSSFSVNFCYQLATVLAVVRALIKMVISTIGVTSCTFCGPEPEMVSKFFHCCDLVTAIVLKRLT